MQHVGAGQQESRAAYSWSNGMEKFSTDTLCKNLGGVTYKNNHIN